jgi:Fe-S-cluster containining protein
VGPVKGADAPRSDPHADAVPVRFLRAYETQAAGWDAEFARVATRFADRLQCRRGCSMCCSQMFPISLLEAAVIRRAVLQLPPDRRERLETAARTYLEEARRRGLMPDPDQDAVLPRTGERLPCPALEGDACTLYDARPLICRKWGIPVFDPAKPDRLHACELNFRNGESIETAGLLEPQRALLDDWAAIKADLRATLPGWRTTTIAEAIVTDHSTRGRAATAEGAG